ncbi:MAG: hypothetical protein TREMPRED_004286 [Tremellales sp. Tagirdzhanova-0007]|nr:MAG: hypothetical protein TREMPRED_004286 [Tremellales sp. Tagirdzhanova-0007]
MATSPGPVRQPSIAGPSTPSPSSPLTSTPLRRNQTNLESNAVERITPTRRSSALSASGVEQRRARRQELRTFYGLKKDHEAGVGDEERQGGRNKVKDGDPLDIDTLSFNPGAYYEELISKSSLSGLMKTAHSLSAGMHLTSHALLLPHALILSFHLAANRQSHFLDIGNLHSSRYALVYNHHHQLFAAGDTISHLNSRTPLLRSIVTDLQHSFSKMSRLVDAVALPEQHDQLAPQDRDKVEMGVERFRLMVIAGEPAEEIRRCYEGFREQLEKGAEDPSGGRREMLAECRKYLDGLPASNGHTATHEGI